MQEKASKFRKFCIDQIQRLGTFEKFQFVHSVAQKEYRRWLERRAAGDETKAAAVMDEAIALEQLPTIADLNRIWSQLYPERAAEPDVTDEERQKRAGYLRDWYAAEARDAEKRRAARKAVLDSRGAPVKLATQEQIEDILAQQTANRRQM